MIISASRRTDIPALYSDWFYGRVREGAVLARNPMRPRQVGRISLAPEAVDGIVFWTKNPAPMMERLHELSAYQYYFQFTLTPYSQAIEPGLPGRAALLDTFRRLSDTIGADRVLWRYDPILISDAYPAERHEALFAEMAQTLRGYTSQCTISFIDDYKNTARNRDALALRPIDEAAMHGMAAALSAIARANGMAMCACAEAADLSADGVHPAACVDAARFGLTRPKDKSQRAACGCAASVDIGVYNTCSHGCLYCYANYDNWKIPNNVSAHDPASPLLTGQLSPEDAVYDRK